MGKSERIEANLSEEYRKDDEDEKFLERLNSILAPFQEEDYVDLPEQYPTLHIIGVPRSGTTLLSQLISAHLDVGYIDNLIASFWRAPVYGVKLSQKLIGQKTSSPYLSDFGRTYGIDEPHEFGYFWSSLLDYREMRKKDILSEQSIDWKRVRLILCNMIAAFGRPVMFKSMYPAWHITALKKILPKTCFIKVKRDPFQNALSLLNLREKFTGSVYNWASLKPLEYEWLKDEHYCTQVAGQVYYLEKGMKAQIEEVGGQNIIEIDYEDLCHNPKAVLLKIMDLLIKNGAKTTFKSDPPDSLSVSYVNNRNSEERALIKNAFKEFEEKDSNEL